MEKAKHLLVIIVIGGLLVVFFGLDFFYYPELFKNSKQNIPEPVLIVSILKNEINLGEPVNVTVLSKNVGDQADVLIVSIGFPNLETINENFKITSYNFTQSPHYVKINDELGARYSAGEEIVNAKYPSIEAYSRPVPNNTTFKVTLQITPDKVGNFEIYSKAIAIPHTSDRSHFPHDGFIDHQEEFVNVQNILVNP